MSLSLASASSQYIRNDNPANMLMPNWRSAICFFRTTTSAVQTLMQCIMRPTSTTFYTRELCLVNSGSTVEVAVNISDSLGAPSTSGAVTSGGIFNISTNTWACAGCSISSSQLDCWLVDAAGNEATPGSLAHSDTEGNAYTKHAIGGDWVGANYMNGQIGHAIAYQSEINVEDFRHVALGRADPRSIGGGASQQLVYWVPFVEDRGIARGTNANAPVKDNGTSTVTAVESIFDTTMTGGTIDFDAGASYAIASYTSPTVIVVTGDASGEGAADTFVVQTGRHYAKQGTVLTGGTAGRTLAFDQQNGPTLSSANPNVFSAAGLLM